MNKKIIACILFLSLLGVFFSGYLLKQHLKNIATGFEEKSFCNINEVINCDLVDMSAYSKIKDIPVSGLSVFFYLNLMLVLIIGLIKQKREPVYYAFLLSVVGFLFSIRMAFISFITLKLVCLFCVGLYLVSLISTLLFPLALGGVGHMKNISVEYFKNRFTKSLLPQALITIVIMAFGIFSLNIQVKAAESEWAQKKKIEQSKKNPQQQQLSVDELVDLFFEQPVVEISTDGLESKGNPSAAVKIVEFSDFECPFCKRAANTFDALIKQYPNDLAFYYVNYPLDKSCNKYMQREMHKSACAASKAATCAGEQNKFWEMHDKIFENQGKFTEKDLTGFAQQLSLNVPLLESCLTQTGTVSKIEKQIDLGQKIQIQGTPAVFVNGRKLSGWNSPELLQAVIKKTIQENKMKEVIQ